MEEKGQESALAQDCGVQVNITQRSSTRGWGLGEGGGQCVTATTPRQRVEWTTELHY